MRIDKSAVQWSAPERERAGRKLIVLLHGYGSHEGDLFALSPGLPLGPVVASLRAPVAESGGYAWWSRATALPGRPTPADISPATEAILAWLDGIEYTSVSLLGFSQGGAMALHLNRAAPGRFTATVCLAGFVVPGEYPGDAQLATLRPPIFWGRGTADQVIPADAVERTEEWLPGHSTATINRYEGLAHSISSQELADLSSFLLTHA
jgi:phospholipase/carboxylesterase